MTSVQSINPANGEVLATYETHTPEQVAHKLDAAQACYLSWRRTSFAERKALLLRVVDVIAANKNDYAKLITQEMGKPLKESLAEVEKCATAAKYFAENGESFLADRIVKTEYTKSFVSFQPIGIVLGVMPWNFPFWQVLRFAYPALMAGNVCLLKHASNSFGCALAIEDIFRKAGLPEGGFQSLLIPGKMVEPVIADSRVRAVTLTGSTPAGRSVAAAAGKYLKKSVLELGGSDPYVILDDCDLEHAIRTCATSRMNNCGQSCVSAKRMIVVEKHKAAFEAGVKAIFEEQKQGNGLDATTTVGPMSRADLRDELHEQVERSVKAGAKLVLGGKNPGGTSAFYPLTILSDVTRDMPAFKEELFGPVAVIIPAKDEAEAIALANESEFGLGGAVFTKDLARGERIAREEIQSGSCFVNMMVRSDPRLPFGGVKDSGYGRELSEFGIHEFVNIKSVVIA